MNFEEFEKEIKIILCTILVMFLVYIIFSYLKILTFSFGMFYGISLVYIHRLIRNKYE